jgi:hypothetical protein
MLDYLDSIPDLQFLTLFMVLIVVAYLIEWALDVWTREKKR